MRTVPFLALEVRRAATTIYGPSRCRCARSRLVWKPGFRFLTNGFQLTHSPLQPPKSLSRVSTLRPTVSLKRHRTNHQPVLCRKVRNRRGGPAMGRKGRGPRREGKGKRNRDSLPKERTGCIPSQAEVETICNANAEPTSSAWFGKRRRTGRTTPAATRTRASVMIVVSTGHEQSMPSRWKKLFGLRCTRFSPTRITSSNWPGRSSAILTSNKSRTSASYISFKSSSTNSANKRPGSCRSGQAPSSGGCTRRNHQGQEAGPDTPR